MQITKIKINCCISLNFLPSGLQSCFQAIWSFSLYKISLMGIVGYFMSGRSWDTTCKNKFQFQVSGLPVCTLLGGRQQESVLLYRAIPQGTPEIMKDMVKRFKDQVSLTVALLEHFCFLLRTGSDLWELQGRADLCLCHLLLKPPWNWFLALPVSAHGACDLEPWLPSTPFPIF